MTFVRPRTLVARLAAAMALSAAALQGAYAQDSTSTLHYKGITLQPIGFVAAEAVWRQRNETADIGSSFNAIPFSGTTNGNMTETAPHGPPVAHRHDGDAATPARRRSRATGSPTSSRSGTTSNSNESNSYTLRIRQFWLSAALANGWTISGGQFWSLMTPDKNGMNPRSEAVPLTIEAQYAAGFNWARQGGLRFVEQAERRGVVRHRARGVADDVQRAQRPADVRARPGGRPAAQCDDDVFDGLLAGPRGQARLRPQGDGSLGAQGRGELVPGSHRGPHEHHRRLAQHHELRLRRRLRRVRAGQLGRPRRDGPRPLGPLGQGIGRYGTVGLPDATVDTDGSLKPIKASQLLLSLEAHPTKNLDIYSYVGAEYADRTAFVNSAGKGVGYGSELNNNSGCQTELAPSNQTTPNSGTCNADTRAVWQANIGFWYRFYKGAAGTLQWGMQYSYTSRNTWSGGGIQPQAIDNMVFNSIRYVLP